MQKSVYLLLLFISTGLISNAQIKQGSWLLGGDVTLGLSNNSAQPGGSYISKSSDFSLSPSLGKAIKENFILGFDLDFTHTQSDYVNPGSPTTTSEFNGYGMGVFLREYKPLGKGFSLFGQERVGGLYTTQSQNGIQDSRGYSLSLGFSPGLAYSICPKIQLEASMPNILSISYGHEKVGTDNSNYNSQNNFSARTNLSNSFSTIVFGFRFVLGS